MARQRSFGPGLSTLAARGDTGPGALGEPAAHLALRFGSEPGASHPLRFVLRSPHRVHHGLLAAALLGASGSERVVTCVPSWATVASETTLEPEEPRLVGPESTADIPTGTDITFGKTFRIVGHLGEGGMGKVFKAFDPFMNRYVALKVMKADVPESEQRRFRLEARLCGSFSHPNLVRVLDVGTVKERGLFWFAMDFLEGTDIRGAMTRGRTVPLHVLCEILRGTLEGLQHVHVRNIVHRDIKPANIFVCRDPHDPQFRPVKVLDFGVARDLRDEAPEEGGWILGDPRYMPPEQTRPNLELDHRADLYALGMTFYEAITGHHPFEDAVGQHPKYLLRCHREREPAPPSTLLGPDTPVATAEVIDGFFAQACAKNKEHRFADARAMQHAMSVLLQHA